MRHQLACVPGSQSVKTRRGLAFCERGDPHPHAQSRLAAFFAVRWHSRVYGIARELVARGIGERDKVERGCGVDLSGQEAVAERTEWNEGTSSSSSDRESELRRDDHLIANRAHTTGQSASPALSLCKGGRQPFAVRDRRHATSSEYQKTRPRPDCAWGRGPALAHGGADAAFCRLTPGLAGERLSPAAQEI